MTNASIMFTAFLIGTISLIIVFVSGITSGVVRMNTLLMRSVFALFMAGAASYFLLMVFDWYYERLNKKLKAELEQVNTEVKETETPAENAADTAPQNSQQNGFKPLNPNELPNV